MTTRKRTTKHAISEARINAILAGIAQGRLGIETLERRGLDRHDFHEVAVWNIRQALLQAYVTGYRDAANDGGRHTDVLVELLGR